MRVYIGHDENEHEAAQVAAKSLRDVTLGEIEPEFLCLPKLVDQGLITRTFDRRGGQGYDLTGNETFSTEFKFSRFLVPIICQQGYGLFVDCDVVFLRDPRDMLGKVHAHHAVSVVKHMHAGLESSKMAGQVQTRYARKNWSSVCLWNVDHPANRRLSLRDVNERPGRDLHAFYHLHDDEIGELAPCWNVLVGVQETPVHAGILHFTLGGPFTPGWQGSEYDHLWHAAANKT